MTFALSSRFHNFLRYVIQSVSASVGKAGSGGPPIVGNRPVPSSPFSPDCCQPGEPGLGAAIAQKRVPRRRRTPDCMAEPRVVKLCMSIYLPACNLAVVTTVSGVSRTDGEALYPYRPIEAQTQRRDAITSAPNEGASHARAK